MNFKIPIGGEYYHHMLQDNLFRWPEVEVVENTSFENLRLALERRFGALGIPEKIIPDNRSLYNG